MRHHARCFFPSTFQPSTFNLQYGFIIGNMMELKQRRSNAKTGNPDTNNHSSASASVSASVSASGYSVSKDEPIDDQEQDEIVKDLQKKYLQQTRQFATIISAICYFAGASSFIMQFLHTFDDSGQHQHQHHQHRYWYSLYPTYVAMLHCHSGYVAQSLIATMKQYEHEDGNSDLDGNSNGDHHYHYHANEPHQRNQNRLTGKGALGIAIAFSVLPMMAHILFVQPTDVWIWILSGSNVYSCATVVYMTMDAMNCIKSLKELEDSKYRHKSL